MPDKLIQIKDYIDIISADIKLGLEPKIHKEFFKQCYGVETFAKIVFDENITEQEIETCIDIAKEFNIELVLQPKMGKNNKMTVTSEFCNEILEKFTAKYPNTRLIPQVHKFLDE